MGLLTEIVNDDKALSDIKSKYAHNPVFDKNFYDLNKDDADFAENLDRLIAFNPIEGFKMPLDILE